MLTPARGVLLW